MRKTNPGLGPLIREYRLSKGLSQSDLARLLSKSTSMFISLMELNKSKVPHALLGEMIYHLDIPEKTVVARIVEHFRQYVESEIENGKKSAARRAPLKSLKARSPKRS